MSYLLPAILSLIIVVLVVLLLRKPKAVAQSPKAARDESVAFKPLDSVEGESDKNAAALFATLSHELRTPLNGLLGVIQMLNEERDDEDLQAIEGCARHMLAVISTLVNHSKIKSEWDDLPEHREWVNIYELLEQLRKHLNFRAHLRGLTIKVQHQDKALRVRGDRDHLRVILENLILGSLEAIPLSGIPDKTQELQIAWTASGKEISIRIKNPLEFFEEDRREKIRSSDGLTTGENHSRIRMEYLYWSVSSMLLAKYHGAMYPTPVDGGGVETSVTFEMEQMKASPSASLPVGGLSLDTPGKASKATNELPFKLSILVAEDDPMARSLMAAVLKLMGQEAKFATNGREALDLVSQSDGFDIIFMDIDMPIMDGMSATVALRNGEAGELGTSVPIVAVTAFSTLSDESKFKKIGMNYFLAKPVKLKNLREVILDVVRKEG